MDSKKSALDVFDYVVTLRRDFHRHPEPGFEERRTTEKIAEALDTIGIPYYRFDPTGLIGEIKGGKPGRTVALRADIDALPVLEKTGLPFASVNEGFMHACGHDTHTAMLLGASRALYEHRSELPGTVKVLFQPAEEVAQGAKKVIAQGALEGVDIIFAQHIGPQMPCGLVAVFEGASHAAADVFKITVKGTICHGAMPELGADATVAAAAIVMNLQTIVSREVPAAEKVVVTIGKFQSGTAPNICSGEAVLEGTARSFDRDLHGKLPDMVARIARNTAEAFRCVAEVDYSVFTDVLVNDKDAAAFARAAALKVTGNVITSPPLMGSEDFAEYTACAKAGFIGLGGGGAHPLHSECFVIDEDAFKTGVAWLIQVAWDYLNA